MNLQQLEYFKVIAETRNFTIASNILSVTHAVLSKSLSKLEEELDVDLFKREGRNIEITNYGEVFLKYVQSALSDIEIGKERLNDMKMLNDNGIIIAADRFSGKNFMPLLISNFFENNLSINFHINNKCSDEILKDLINEKIDFGFFSSIEKIDDFPEVEYVLIKEDKVNCKNIYMGWNRELCITEIKSEFKENILKVSEI